MEKGLAQVEQLVVLVAFRITRVDEVYNLCQYRVQCYEEPQILA